MTSEVRQRLKERRERQELERLLHDASEIVTAPTLATPEVPAGVLDAVRGFWSMSHEPAATLNDSVPQEHLDAWVQELLARHGFHTSAFLLTDLDVAPWIEFCMPPGWFATIRRAREASWVFLRSDLGAVAAVSEQEYQFEFFVAPLPHATPNPPRVHAALLQRSSVAG
ncbi:hypothetical protein AB0I66_00490 [Streptomyces sp. NPDC050439]|uniref:hypothetical protein n=1 Tax=unclassified Streptomyces TaxID=2593676 RepID=UPI0034329FE3